MPLDFVLLSSTDLTDESLSVYDRRSIRLLMLCYEGKLLRLCLVYKARHKKPNLLLHELHNLTICDIIITLLSKKKKRRRKRAESSTFWAIIIKTVILVMDVLQSYIFFLLTNSICTNMNYCITICNLVIIL